MFAANNANKLNAKPNQAGNTNSSSTGPLGRLSRVVSSRRSVSRQKKSDNSGGGRVGDCSVLMSRPSEHIWVRNDKDVWQLVRKVATVGDAVEVEVKGEKLRVSFKNTLPFEPEHLESWDDVFQVS
jgi:hypothetical protein